ncbi:MAG TPA: hypothetical protein VHT73_05840 [Thermodesulfobacteriota bacterium]|nr:hypothetical protein [Thermodesulfobacteriota bacterium]
MRRIEGLRDWLGLHNKGGRKRKEKAKETKEESPSMARFAQLIKRCRNYCISS